MKFSLFALAGLAASAVAAPFQAARRAEITAVSDVTTVVQGLLVTVRSHTAVINSTLASQDGTVVGDVVNTELAAVVAAVTNVVSTLSSVDVVLTGTTDEVQVIAGVVFSIVSEVVATVQSVLAVVGIPALLNTVIGAVVSILAQLIVVVNSVVGGVLPIVSNLINVSGILSTATGALAGLPLAIFSNAVSLL